MNANPHEPAERVMRRLVRGLGLGLFIATGLSGWAVLMNQLRGSEPFERVGTSLGRVVLLYYLGFSLGGITLGALLPLRKWRLGSMLLGFLFVLPVYSSFVFLDATPAERFSSWNVYGTLIGSLVVGGGLGLWVWSNETKH